MKTSNILTFVIRLLVAAAFISSGLLKLYPVEFFENDLLIHHLSTESLVVYESRVLIASEIILGVGILITLWDRVFLTLSFLMLALYSIYLVIIYFTEGNDGNCGCFGNAVVLTPLEGILKNIVIAGLLGLIWKRQRPWPFRYRNAWVVAVTVIGLTTPFILYPVFFSEKVLTSQGEKTVLPLERLYTTPGEIAPTIDLRKDKQVVAFFLLNCKHCRLAAARLEAIKRDNPELPVYIILCGADDGVSDFINESMLQSIPYTTFHSLDDLIKISGPDFPAIYLLNNGMIDAELGFYDIQSTMIEEWYHKP